MRCFHHTAYCFYFIASTGLQMNSSNLKHWLSRGDLDKLEHVVLEGRGTRLLGEQSPDLRTRVFLKGLPNYLVGIKILNIMILTSI